MENVEFEDEIEFSNIEPDVKIVTKDEGSIDDYFYDDDSKMPFYYNKQSLINEFIKQYPESLKLNDSVTSTKYMFRASLNATKYPKEINTENITDMSYMFYQCCLMKEVPKMNTSNVTNMASMFYDCEKIETIPFMDTSNVTDMNEMFNYCYSLKSIPLLDTSKVTRMGTMFQYCRSLQTIPAINTSSATDMAWMFSGCSSLQTLPDLNTSNVTDMRSMFQSCINLKKIPNIDTSNVTTLTYIFNNCTNLLEIPELEAGNLVSITNWSNNVNTNVLFGGFKDLGKAENYKTNMNLTKWTNIQTPYNILKDLYDLNLNGKAGQGATITISSSQQSQLLEIDSEIIENTKNKGWNVTISG